MVEHNAREASVLLNSIGDRVNWLELEPKHISIEHIANSLGNLCRFNGACSIFYSVAEHCYHLTQICPPHLRFYALFHDAAEAYIGDFVYPIKKYVNEHTDAISKLEKHIEQVIFDKWEVPALCGSDAAIFNEIDRAFGRREAFCLFGHNFKYITDPKNSEKILSLELLERVNTRELEYLSPPKAKIRFFNLAKHYLLPKKWFSKKGE